MAEGDFSKNTLGTAILALRIKTIHDSKPNEDSLVLTVDKSLSELKDGETKKNLNSRNVFYDRRQYLIEDLDQDLKDAGDDENKIKSAKDAYETDLSIAAGAYECVLRCRVTVCAGIFIKTKVFNIKHDQHPIRAVMAIMGQSAYYAYLLTNVGPRGRQFTMDTLFRQIAFQQLRVEHYLRKLYAGKGSKSEFVGDYQGFPIPNTLTGGGKLMPKPIANADEEKVIKLARVGELGKVIVAYYDAAKFKVVQILPDYDEFEKLSRNGDKGLNNPNSTVVPYKEISLIPGQTQSNFHIEAYQSAKAYAQKELKFLDVQKDGIGLNDEGLNNILTQTFVGMNEATQKLIGKDFVGYKITSTSVYRIDSAQMKWHAVCSSRILKLPRQLDRILRISKTCWRQAQRCFPALRFPLIGFSGQRKKEKALTIKMRKQKL